MFSWRQQRNSDGRIPFISGIFHWRKKDLRMRWTTMRNSGCSLRYVGGTLSLACISCFSAGVFPAIGSTPGCSPVRPQTFPHTALRAFAEISRPSRGHLEYDRRRQPGHRFCGACYPGHKESADCRSNADVPIRNGKRCPRQVGVARHGLDRDKEKSTEGGGEAAIVRHYFFMYDCQNSETLSSIIFELIQGEMAYVKDLENIDTVCQSFTLLNLLAEAQLPTDVCSTITFD